MGQICCTYIADINIGFTSQFTVHCYVIAICQLYMYYEGCVKGVLLNVNLAECMREYSYGHSHNNTVIIIIDLL